LRDLALGHGDDVQIVYPVHLNPHVQASARDLLAGVPNITLLPPLEYLPFVHLMKQSYLILTDSGGLQEEAPSLGKPVLVLRNTTERVEALAAGTAQIVGTARGSIVEATEKLLEEREAYERMVQAQNPYGDGQAGKRIIEAISEDHGGREA
jgi:UDP-N-acetylglucosamine 2-epimerase